MMWDAHIHIMKQILMPCVFALGLTGCVYGAPGYYGGGPAYYGGGYGSSVPYFHGHPNAGW